MQYRNPKIELGRGGGGGGGGAHAQVFLHRTTQPLQWLSIWSSAKVVDIRDKFHQRVYLEAWNIRKMENKMNRKKAAHSLQ